MRLTDPPTIAAPNTYDSRAYAGSKHASPTVRALVHPNWRQVRAARIRRPRRRFPNSRGGLTP